MGAKNSTIAQGKLNTLTLGSEGLEKNVESLEATLQSFSKEFFSREEIETRLSKVQEAQCSSADKLAQLIELNKEQQQIIFDLGSKYSQLSDDYCKQQKMFIEMTGRYEDKFNRYEEGLFEARSKLHEIEKEVIANSEFGKVLGIRRSENMIRKEKINTRSNTKKTPEKGKALQAENKGKGREKLQNARNLRKLEKEAQSGVSEEGSSRQENSQNSTELYDSNSSGLNKSELEKADSKEVFVEMNTSTF